MVSLAQAIEGYLLAAKARRLSSATLADYSNTFRKLTACMGDVDLARITPADVRFFLAGQDASRKTVLNMHIALSALWTWAVRENLTVHHVMRDVQAPKAPAPVVEPFTPEDVKSLMRALDQSKPYDRPGKRTTVHRLPLATRNRAIILTLLDTGVRASELCGLLDADVDLKNQRIIVLGKGAKHRMLRFSDRTGQALWKYRTQHRSHAEHPAPEFFLTIRGNALSRNDLLHLLVAIGKRAELADVHPHRFRHTFAIEFLRNGGNIYMLQQMLGHTSLDMVRRYLHIVQSDLESAHQQASPVANWRL